MTRINLLLFSCDMANCVLAHNWERRIYPCGLLPLLLLLGNDAKCFSCVSPKTTLGGFLNCVLRLLGPHAWAAVLHFVSFCSVFGSMFGFYRISPGDLGLTGYCFEARQAGSRCYEEVIVFWIFPTTYARTAARVFLVVHRYVLVVLG